MFYKQHMKKPESRKLFNFLLFYIAKQFVFYFIRRFFYFDIPLKSKFFYFALIFLGHSWILFSFYSTM